MGIIIIENVIFGVILDIIVLFLKDCVLFFSWLSSMFLVSYRYSS